MAMLKRAGKVAAEVVPAVTLARLGLPALGAVVFLSVLLLAAACWVIGSRDRAERVSQMLLAWRGNPGSLAAGSPAAPGLPARRRGRWPWRRRL